MSKKKLLIYAHYYYPDVASTGQILTDLAERITDKFEITVICVVPSYTGVVEEKYKEKWIYHESYNGVKVIRVRVPEFNKSNKVSRIKNLLAYFINAIRVTFKLEKQDYIFSISQPPIMGGLLGVIGKWIKGGKFIYNIQDFNPEQIKAVGYSKSKSIMNFAMHLDKFSCKRADKIIVVGRDMQETLVNRFRGENVPKNVFINNWINEKEVYPLKSDNLEVLKFKEKYGLQDKYIIMYSGNIGLYYDLKNIIKVIAKFKTRDDIVFAFIGDGTVKKDIEEYVDQNNISNVKFIPYQPKDKINYSFNAADVHLVVNAKGIKGVSVPSKLYGVMAAGKAVLGVLEENSEARLIIEESDCGICMEPGEYEEIYKGIEYVLNNKDSIDKKGINGRVYLEKNLSKEFSISKYREEILLT